MGAITGRCLCGGVRFEFDRAAGPFEVCHCTRCRKSSGASALPMLRVRRADYRLLAGRELVRSYEAPILYRPPAYRASFCATCGSPVPSAEPDGDWLEIPAGLLDDDPGMRPDKHIFVEFVPDWDEIDDALPRYTVRELVRERTGRELPGDFRPRRHGEPDGDRGQGSRRRARRGGEEALSLADPRSVASRALVAWYGLFQAAHLLLNARYQLVPFSARPPLPFAGPAEGWLPQTERFMSGMAVADLMNAALSLVFVAGFFRGARSIAWLGTVTLTVSVYAEFAFLWGAAAAGAPALGPSYLWANLPFVPVIVLFFAWSYWVLRGRLT